eukprot:426984_1
MSKGGFSKRSAKGSKASTTNNSPAKSDVEDEGKMMVKFVFEGQKFHARTPICFEPLTLEDLLQKTHLDMSLPAPTARQLFEMYFNEDIYPYAHHNIQSHIRNKRDRVKLWDAQSNTLQNIYQERAKLLNDEWMKRRQFNKQHKQRQSDIDLESARRKAELKAKNKVNKQKWKDEIAMRIASGQFDQLEPSKPQHKKRINPSKKPNQNKKNPKKTPSKSAKKKKKRRKKWKDKRTKNVLEWPVMNNNNDNNSPNLSHISPTKTPIKPKLQKLQTAVKPTGYHGKWIHSELRYKFVLRSEHREYVMDDGMEQQSLAQYIANGCSDLVLIKVRIHLDSCRIDHKEQMLLRTDKDHVLLTVNQQNNNMKLFEILWIRFGHAIKERIDTQRTDVVFVKKSNTLRVKIPILSI